MSTCGDNYPDTAICADMSHDGNLRCHVLAKFGQYMLGRCVGNGRAPRRLLY